MVRRSCKIFRQQVRCLSVTKGAFEASRLDRRSLASPRCETGGSSSRLVWREGLSQRRRGKRADRAVVCPSSRSGGAEGAGAQKKGKKAKQAVVEHVLLLRLDPESLGAKEAKACIENLWSLQYQVGGVICSSAGANDDEISKQIAKHNIQNQGKDFCHYTHAVHFRFPSTAELDRFLASPVLHKMQEEQVTPHLRHESDMVSVSFESSIPEDLFAIFRKGEDWDEGFEHIVLLECKDGAHGKLWLQDVENFAERNQPIMAESGLQQLTYGLGRNDESKIGLLMRFRNEYDFEYFTNSNLYKDLLGSNGTEPGSTSSITMSMITYEVGSQEASNL